MCSRSPLVRAHWLLTVALLLLPALQAGAANSLYSLARVRLGLTPICQQGGQDFQMAEVLCVIPAVGVGFVDTRGDAESDSLYGTLRVYTRLATTNADGRTYDAHANSTFTDSLVIYAAGHPIGSSGNAVLNFTVDVTHTIHERVLTSGSAFPDTDFFLTIDGNSRTQQGTFPTIWFFQSFQYGVPFEISASVQTKVVCNSCSGRYDIETDGLNTATLDLITVNGLELSEFEVFSESAAVYANVVPEPGPLVGLLAAVTALSMLAAVEKRRSR